MRVRDACVVLVLLGLVSASAAQSSPSGGAPLPAPALPPPQISSGDGGADQGAGIAPQFTGTQLLKRGGPRGFGITDVEGSIEVPTTSLAGAPVKVSPGVAVRWWDGPRSPTDLPSTVYDIYTDISWEPRVAEWLFLDLKATPGIYTDLDNKSTDAIRPRGHALGIIALSEQFQIVAGGMYVNRLRTKFIPAGGIRYAPSEDTEFRLVFPAPRITQKIFTAGDTKINLFAEGEFGGGAWAIERANGADDTVDYSDLRLLGGLEAVTKGGAHLFGEAGFVFHRRIDYASDVPTTFYPANTVLFRLGLSY